VRQILIDEIEHPKKKKKKNLWGKKKTECFAVASEKKQRSEPLEEVILHRHRLGKARFEEKKESVCTANS